ncbi:hypothetical protein MIMGU_mgv1a008472mg [Erythranthe guttata]|uniref:TF-B3 domain-containing protein n=1 Tax=Erythranthe guttata TaxID=4155 RepID=A0A022QKQ0_ERYGU|nr:hypothetical protein MIMGU_mgv1a008472mg [Erythranthe guttata]
MEILKLFGVEIHVNPLPEYSSAPTSRRQSPPLPQDDVQEKRVPESLVAADVITGIHPSSAAVHEEDVHNLPPPTEYSSTPSCSCPVAVLPPDDVQEKRVPESQAAVAAAADVITGNLPCSSSSGDGTKIPTSLKPSKKRKFDGSHDSEPLQSFPPMNHQEVGPTSPVNGRKNKKAKPDDEKKSAAEKKSPVARKSKRKTSIGNEEEAAVPLEEIPGSSSSNNTRRPVFLYRKKLEESDVNPGLNRLMVNREEKMLEFLTEEERKDVLTPRDQKEKPRGLELTGLDQNGKLYKLCYKLWASLNKTAINKQWNKLIAQHNAKKGDWVEVWGYRVINNEHENENGPRFVINFRKNDPNILDDRAAAGSSSSSILT